MQVGSFRWWFQNRETGAITIAQPPNPPLFVAVVGWLIGRLFEGGAATIGGVFFVGALLFWGGDEIVRGINPWRRLLGTIVVVWQVLRLVG